MRADADEEEDDGEEDAELVARGTFRVDPSVAAEKLRDYQLPDAKAFLVPWLRAAVASGARRVEAGTEGGALTFSFDGAPPDTEVLADLTAGLLPEDHGEAARHLAFGALALERLSPAAARGEVRGGRTCIRVSWEDGGRTAAGALERLRDAYGMTAAALFIDGKAVRDPARAVVPVKTWETPKACVVVHEDFLTPGSGRLRFYKLGALVETAAFDFGGRYSAFVANDRFVLSLSQSAVRKDKRYGKTLRRLERLRRRLARREPSLPSKVRDWATLAGAALAAAASAAGAAYWFLVLR